MLMNVYAYYNYRKYLQDYYEYQKSVQRYSPIGPSPRRSVIVRPVFIWI
jgi:hypothetical protein